MFFFLISTGTGDFTVAFIGSGDGYLKKVVIESDSTGVLYADIPIRPGHSVRPDIVFDLKREHVYVMTDKKVSKVCFYYDILRSCSFTIFCYSYSFLWSFFFHLLRKDLIITEKIDFLFCYICTYLQLLSRIYAFLTKIFFMQFLLS